MSLGRTSLLDAPTPDHAKFWFELGEEIQQCVKQRNTMPSLVRADFESAYVEITGKAADGTFDGQLVTPLTAMWQLTDRQGILGRSFFFFLEGDDLLYVQTMDGAVQIWNLTPLQFRDDGGNPIVGNRYAYIQGDNDWLFPGFDKSLFEAGNQALSDIQLYSPFPAEISFGKPVPTSFVLEHGKVAERVFTGEVYEPSATKDPYVRTIEYAASFSHPADETGKTEIRSVVLGLEHWYPTRDAGRLVNLVRNGGYLSFYLGSQINGSDIKIWP